MHAMHADTFEYCLMLVMLSYVVFTYQVGFLCNDFLTTLCYYLSWHIWSGLS
jgi:hypothetical protein